MLNIKTPKSEAQAKFDATYITAAQIMLDLQISRPALLYARRSGRLPDPIVANDGHLYIWERVQVDSLLKEWKISLDTRRGV